MLNLSTKGRYATRIMVFLAQRQETTPARKQEIAEAEEISIDYVEQILIRLKIAGLVKSHRGVKGGFSIAGDPDRITVADVLDATEGSTDLVPCLKGHCHREPHCVTRPVWQQANAAMTKTFSSYTIGDLARQVAANEHRGAVNFDI
jgi:Rrf2 family transcriptional regulator, iron-sulfur cluster assembly transcription factor